MQRIVHTRLPTALLLLTATLGYCALWWPGHMSADFLTMYASALNGTPGDFHSPAFVFLLEALMPLGAGPGWVLFAQLGGLLLGLFLILRVGFSRLRAAWLAIALLGTPMALGMGGSLSRDVWFAEAALVALGSAIAIRRHEGLVARRIWTILGVLALLAMLLSRQNGLFAVGPAALAIYGGWRPQALRAWRPAFLAMVGATVAAGALLLVLQQAMYRIGDVEHQNPQAALYVYDLAAMAQLGAPVELPASSRNKPMSDVVGAFTTQGMSGLIWSGSPPARFPAPGAPQDDLASAWRSAIVDHPVTWWRARMRLWTYQAALVDRAIFIYHPQLDPNTLGFATRWPGLEKAANGYIRAFTTPDLRGSMLFDVWIYLVIAGIAIRRLWRQDGIWRLASLVGVTSLTYQIGLFALAPVAEYRFEYASVVAGLALLPLLLVAGRRVTSNEPTLRDESASTRAPRLGTTERVPTTAR